MMTKMVNRGLLAAFAASALALIGAFLMAGSASANPGTVTLSAGAIADNSVTVSVNVAPASGETVAGVIAAVTFDSTKLTATACTPAATCNLTPPAGAGTVLVGMGPNLSGLGANAGSVTFSLASGFTTGSTAVGITVQQCQNELGSDITCTGTGTSIAIATPTPTPAPTTAAPTATPSPTPKALPQTGGPTGESSSMLTWLLVAAGLVIVSGGAWAVSRARREI